MPSSAFCSTPFMSHSKSRPEEDGRWIAAKTASTGWTLGRLGFAPSGVMHADCMPCYPVHKCFVTHQSHPPSSSHSSAGGSTKLASASAVGARRCGGACTCTAPTLSASGHPSRNCQEGAGFTAHASVPCSPAAATARRSSLPLSAPARATHLSARKSPRRLTRRRADPLPDASSSGCPATQGADTKSALRIKG